jgi:hypothetical protein
MSGHDPLCPWHIDRLLGDCQCDLIDEVRVDEIKRHEQEVIDAIETTSAMVRKHTTERIAQAIEKMPDAHHPELFIVDVLVWRSDAARIAREFGASSVDNEPEA